ncbi:hypothetical protein AOQ84DRAFT_352399 [Glonium stellatum]|uniref:B-related factor 1 n=1 Tax=Glonium stellatum TaxID=574774 RepID=A0A8E2F9A7_9PEZI|nr:hypothetical protein AOQ84DRAFT_352399 [Glonium stellatum]
MSTPHIVRAPRERLSSLKNPGPSKIFSQAHRKAQAPKSCCGTPDIQEHDSNRVCLSCGTILSDSNIVSEVTFGETSAGAAVVQGAFVGEGQRHAKTMGSAFRRAGGGMESREQTEYNGRDEIRKLAGALHLPTSTEEQAFGIYKLAATNNFIQGRRTRTVAAVCLYVACRRVSGNTVLLMDLAEKIQVNVFKLGEVYKDLVKDLWLGDTGASGINAVLEVEPLILKFARKLEFGDLTMQVATDAAKIVKRMKRDWMVEGRQPAGLCGACIILAARMNNFRRTIREVVYVVKVADVTIFSRLAEFKRTQSSGLTVEQFRQFGERLKVQTLPPAIYKRLEREGRKKRKLSQLISEEPMVIPDEEVQAGSSQTHPVIVGPSQVTPSSMDAGTSQEPRRDADGFIIPDLPIGRSLLEASNIAHSELQANEQEGPSPSLSPTKKPLAKKRKKKNAEPVVISEEDLEIENELEEEIERILTDPDTLGNLDDSTYQASHARAKALAEQVRGPSVVSEETEVGEEEFADDPEVMNCKLSPEEIAIKERIWVTHNEDWLRQQQAKLLKKSLEEANGGPKKKQQRKRKHLRMGDGSVLEGSPASSPAEATQRMLQKRSKGFSKHINYERLNEIYRNITDKDKEKGASSEDFPQGNETRERQSPVSSQVSLEAESPQPMVPAIRRTRAIQGPAVHPMLPAGQTTQATQPAIAPVTRTPPAVTEEDDEDDEEEDEEDETEANVLREFGVDDGQEFEDDEVGFDEGYGEGYE